MSALPPQRQPAAADLAGLLARVARGDPAAFAALYHRTAAQVLTLVTVMLGDPAAAEDLTAAVYQQLWHTAARYDPARGGAHAWVMSVAHRRAAAHLRAYRGTAAPPVGPGALHPLPAALGHLDAPSRELILLVCCRGYTAAQAASLLGLPAGTAGPRLLAALRALSPHPAQQPLAAITAPN